MPAKTTRSTKTTPRIPAATTLRPVTSFDDLIGKGITPLKKVEVPELGIYYFASELSWGQLSRVQSSALALQNSSAGDSTSLEAVSEAMKIIIRMMADNATDEKGEPLFTADTDEDVERVMERLPLPVITAFIGAVTGGNDGAAEVKKSSKAKPRPRKPRAAKA